MESYTAPLYSRIWIFTVCHGRSDHKYHLRRMFTVNIFIVHADPVVAAQSLCDKHVPKMLLESAQMLSTAVQKYTDRIEELYKPIALPLFLLLETMLAQASIVIQFIPPIRPIIK